MLDWDDVRYFLELAEAGSLAGAGRRLRVKHTTIARHVSQLEEVLGVALITRSPEGVQLTQAGRRALDHARTAAAAIDAMARELRGTDDVVQGVVRLAVSHGFAGYLARRLVPLKQRYPDLNVHMVAGNQAHDLARGQADLAVRIRGVKDPGLRIRRLGRTGWTAYAAAGYLENKTRPRDVGALRDHQLIGFDDELQGVAGATWLREQGLADHVVLKTNSLGSALNAALGGMGIAVLPCLMAEEEVNLVRLFSEVLCGKEISLVAHPDILRSARVRAVWDYLVGVVEEDRARISGVSAGERGA